MFLEHGVFYSGVPLSFSLLYKQKKAGSERHFTICVLIANQNMLIFQITDKLDLSRIPAFLSLLHV